MASPPVSTPPRMTVDEFLAWAETQPERYELESGRVVAMSPERVRHARVKAVIHRVLEDGIRQGGLPCEALPDGMTVRIDAQTAYEPDALVYCGPLLPGDATAVPAPVVIVEVLSPSTAYRDFGAKLAGYFGLGSVVHYLIVDPERRMLVHHARTGPDLIATRILGEGRLRLDPPGLDLAVADLFGAPD